MDRPSVNSLIFATATRLISALMLVFSIFMLLRGHNAPGGGFVGGLVAVTAFAVYGKARGIAEARRALYVEPTNLAVAGLGLALLAGIIAMLLGDPFLTGEWVTIGGGSEVGGAHDAANAGASSGGAHDKSGIPLSTVLLFDVGVYLVVVGAVLGVLFAMEEET